MNNPAVKMWSGVVIAFIIVGSGLFVLAWTINYWQAWAYLGIGAVSVIFLTLSVTKDPVLLKSRMKVGPTTEKRPIQKVIVLSVGLPGIAAFIVPGLDHRFGWSSVPSWLSIVCDFLIMVGVWIVCLVFRENSFGSTAVEIAKDQKVISTGLYAIVRHPMYAGAVVCFVAMSLALGSYWGLIASVLMTLGLIWRLHDEEKFLTKNLPGYKEYCGKVNWRLIRGIF